MRWLIASVPHCPWWFMGASVSRSVSSRQEFTDKEAVRQTYPSRATLKTVRKTGSSKAAQQAGGVLVTALSVCVMPCVELRFPFQFCEGSSGWLTVLISTIKGSSQGCWMAYVLCAFTLVLDVVAGSPWNRDHLNSGSHWKASWRRVVWLSARFNFQNAILSQSGPACEGPGVRIYIERPSAQDWTDCRCWF